MKQSNFDALEAHMNSLRKENEIYCRINKDLAAMLNKYFYKLGLLTFDDRQAFVNNNYPELKDQYQYINDRQAVELIEILKTKV